MCLFRCFTCLYHLGIKDGFPNWLSTFPSIPGHDMVIASILMSLGMMMLSPMLVALPFKLLLFVLVDGGP